MLMTLQEVSGAIKLCESQIYGLIRKGEFPTPIKLGRSSRWRKSEVEAWVDKKTSDRDRDGRKAA